MVTIWNTANYYTHFSDFGNTMPRSGIRASKKGFFSESLFRHPGHPPKRRVHGSPVTRRSIFTGGAASPLPATVLSHPQPKAAQKRQNQAIRKNNTIPQPNFHSSWGLSPEVPQAINYPSHNESNAPAPAAQAHQSIQGRLSREMPYPVKPCTSSPTWTKSSSLQSRQKAC